MDWICAHREGIALLLHCQPGAKVSKIVGEHDGRLKIALNDPPIDNRANDVLIAWLSDRLDVPRKQIEILSGHSSRKKRLLIRGSTNEKILASLVS